MHHSIVARTVFTLLALGLGAPIARAQAASAPSPTVDAATPPIEYATVDQARAALEARDGNGTIVTHGDGWEIINEPLAKAQWTFTSAGHAAHPAVVRRIIQRGADGAVSVDTASLCEAPKPACEHLLVEFQALNDRITQAVKARGRQGSSQP